jgi:pyridinium-3,5-biscarboxylic acid mononucleotide sulfurtransferase
VQGEINPRFPEKRQNFAGSADNEPLSGESCRSRVASCGSFRRLDDLSTTLEHGLFDRRGEPADAVVAAGIEVAVSIPERDDSGMTLLIPESQVSPAVVADRLLDSVRAHRRVAIAFSGGVDSAVVAAAAFKECEFAVAITAVSPSLASGELEQARSVAAVIGIPHEVVSTSEFERPGYLQNAGNRCYFCKSELYEQLETLAGRLAFDVILNGTNVDDLGDHRPGLVAAAEHRVRSPLADAGLRKADVRAIAKLWGLPVWDKPASPCLSSRIAYGVEATPERVQRIDAAERFLKSLLNIEVLRVRCEAGDLARIEVPLDALPALVESTVRARIASELKNLGFGRVTIDLEGFRSGSLNDALPIVQITPLSSPDAGRR